MEVVLKALLRNREIVILISIAAAVKTLLLIVVAPFASITAPDELGYASLVSSMSVKGIPELIFGQTPTNFRAGFSFYFPSIIFHKLGITPLLSIRIISSLMALLCLYIFFRLSQTLLNINGTSRQVNKASAICTVIYCFIPSHFFWSTIGLRESTVEFWILFTFFLTNKLFNSTKVSLHLLSGILVSIVCVFSTRPQVALILVLTLVLISVAKIRLKTSKAMLLVSLIGLMLGQSVTSEDFRTQSKQTFTVISESPANATTVNTAVSRCSFNGQMVEAVGIDFQCIKQVDENSLTGIKNSGKEIANQAASIPQHHKLNQVGAESAIRTIECPDKGTSNASRLLCFAWRAPYTTYTFLFRPLPGADVTSTSSLFAAIENVYWLGAILFVAVMFIRNRRLAFFVALAPSLLFSSIYSVAAGAYEGNMGTAFRHKSLILWVVILLVASTIVATQQRKAERQGISGSSKE